MALKALAFVMFFIAACKFAAWAGSRQSSTTQSLNRVREESNKREMQRLEKEDQIFRNNDKLGPIPGRSFPSQREPLDAKLSREWPSDSEKLKSAADEFWQNADAVKEIAKRLDAQKALEEAKVGETDEEPSN